MCNLSLTICILLIAVSSVAETRVPLASHAQGKVTLETDLGETPASQMLAVTVRLKPNAERQTAFAKLVSEQQTPGSSSYRKWVTPTEFADQFGATEEDITAVTTWVESQGLAVSGISAGKTRIEVSGTSARIAQTFGVQFRQYRGVSASGAAVVYYASVGAASVPASLDGLISGVSGLDNRPVATAMAVEALGAGGAALSGGDSLLAIEAIVDANAASSLTVATQACSRDSADGDVADYEAVLRQAEAQGITVLATAGCGAGSFPAGLAELTGVASLDPRAGTDTGTLPVGIGQVPNDGRDDGESECSNDCVARPGWQFAVGLPKDELRAAPDVAADVAALAQTLAGISLKIGTRLGNVGPVLYSLAKLPGLFSQPDGARAGTWEAATGLGVVDLKELAKDFPQGSTGTSSLLVPSNYAPTHGSSVTFTATVTSTGGSGIPTGTVTFTSTQQGMLGTAVLNAQGVATFTSNSLAGGTYTLTSVYGGDSTYTGSTSGIATVTVVGEVSVITATVSPGAAVGGNASIVVSVTSVSGVGTPGGTVTVAPQGTKDFDTATASLTGSNGTATGTILLPVFESGEFTLLISCTDPDPSFTCYSPLSIQMTVGKGGTATTISASPDQPAAGAAYTLTVTVAGDPNAQAVSSMKNAVGKSALRGRGAKGALVINKSADTTISAPTGNVQFMDGTTYLATGALSGGVATYSGTATTATHSFNAMYSGDQNYNTSSSTTTPAATGLTPTSTSLTASSYAVVAGQTISLYTSVYSVGVASTMTGTVTYSAASQGVLGTANVSGGTATLTLNTLAPGTYNLTASYSGDSVFAASASVTSVIVTVTGKTVTLTGSLSPTTLYYGSDATLTAIASYPAGVIGGPAGTLLATISGTGGATFTQALVPSAATASSVAAFTFAAPAPGTYTVTISCPAADAFTCVAPAVVPMTVLKGKTATTLTLNPVAPLAGQPVTLMATISNLGNDPKVYAFTGTVQFYANNALLGTGTVSGATASISAALSAGAAESLTAVYSGDVDWITSTSPPVVVTVALLPTSVVVTSNVTNAVSGAQVELTATVTNTAGGPLATTAPSGSVTFYDTAGGAVSKLGTAPLASLGANTSVAMFNATGLTAGANSVYAVYFGDTVYLGSTSTAITVGATNFDVTFIPTTMTVNQGHVGVATLVVNYQGGFNGSVSFGCTPPPDIQMTCSFSPAVLTVGGTTTLSVGTVVGSAAHGSGETSDGRMGGRLAGGAAMAIFLFWLRPKKRLPGVLLVLLTVASLGAIGCTGTSGLSSNGGATSPVTTPSVPGTSLGTQLLSITTAGSDGTNTVRHDFQYQVTVQ